MPTNHHYQATIVRTLAIISLLCFGIELKAIPQETRAPAEPAAAYHVPSLRKYSFKNAEAADVLKILQQLSGETTLGVAVDERTNSLVFLADDQKTREMEASYAMLDSDSLGSNGTKEGLRLLVPALGPQPLPLDFSVGTAQPSPPFNFYMGGSSSESCESLKQRYDDLEVRAHQLADELKQSTSLSESQRAELQQAVRNSFDARQSLQRAELAELAVRMKSMQQSIDMRDKLVEKIVQKRADDLLNPNLKWDADQLSRPSLANQSRVPSTSSTPLPKSPAPMADSVPYVPGERAESGIRSKIQGGWIADTFMEGNKDQLPGLGGQFEIVIDASTMTMKWRVGDVDMAGPIFMAIGKFADPVQPREGGQLPIDFVIDPNGEHQIRRGIIACDGKSLSICMNSAENRMQDFRPSLFIPGSNVILIQCHRAISDAGQSTGKKEANLSTPQATLDYLHESSLAHPKEFPAECYTDDALVELSGFMLQHLSMMSMLSQMQAGEGTGEKDGRPITSSNRPSFFLQVDALLKEHSLAMPPEMSEQAFRMLIKETLGSVPINQGAVDQPTSIVKPKRELIRLAAGILKSPKDFIPAAAKLLDSFFGDRSTDSGAKVEPATPPKYDISLDGNNATANMVSEKLGGIMSFKLQRVQDRWLVSQVYSDEALTLMMPHVFSPVDAVHLAK